MNVCGYPKKKEKIRKKVCSSEKILLGRDVSTINLGSSPFVNRRICFFYPKHFAQARDLICKLLAILKKEWEKVAFQYKSVRWPLNPFGLDCSEFIFLKKSFAVKREFSA